jgi:hypothetical protein
MSDALSQAKQRLAIGLDREPPFFEPLIADQWVIKSLLQKSIRRGEVEIAQRAAAIADCLAFTIGQMVKIDKAYSTAFPSRG